LAVTTPAVKELLAVRAVANDAIMSSSETELSDSWYGPSNPVNFKSHCAACSFGQLTCNPFNGVTSTNAMVSNGVATVNIYMSVVGNNHSNVREAMRSEATTQLGDLRTQFSHVMLCLPPGTNGNWIAYGYINWWLTVYNDNWCTYVSSQVRRL
jgi:hypothetical protein